MENITPQFDTVNCGPNYFNLGDDADQIQSPNFRFYTNFLVSSSWKSAIKLVKHLFMSC